MDRVLERSDAVRRWLDAELAAFVARGPRPIACTPGCTACCHYPLRVHAWELPALLQALAALDERRRRLVKQLARLGLERLRPQRARWRRFPESETDRLAYCRENIRCPLLLTDLCVVYAVRPTHCRLHVVVSEPASCAGGDQPVMVPDVGWLERGLATRLAADGLEAPGRGRLLLDVIAREMR